MAGTAARARRANVRSPLTGERAQMLRFAAMVVGGTDALRAKLDVPQTQLNAWLQGTEELPAAVVDNVLALLSRGV